jgi:hypothetical protein
MLPTSGPAGPVPRPSQLRVGGLSRRLLAAMMLCLGLVPAASALTVLASGGPAGAVAAPCQPHIAHVGKFAPGKAPNVTITGTCFGTSGAFNGDSNHFRITDLGPHGTIAELENAGKIAQTWWNACAGSTDAINGYSPNVVTCDVPSWSNTSVTLRSFGTYYGEDGWVVDPGDKIVVQVWHANAPTSASWCLVDVVAVSAAGGGTTCSSVVVAGDPVISGGSKEQYAGTDHFGPNHKLLPSPVGDGQCQYQEFSDSSYQAQIALSGANCTEADAVGIGAFQARGAAYNSDGFACSATSAGAGSEWASTWEGTYYIYDCKAATAQVAFNWGTHYNTSGVSSSSGESSTGTLAPSPLGEGQCQAQEFADHSVQAQIAVSEANCTQADAVGIGANKAKGAAYSADGFACKATAEGAGSKWASAWAGTYYAYNCKSGPEQVAFNWGAHYTY